jgi:hypothetical protein
MLSLINFNANNHINLSTSIYLYIYEVSVCLNLLVDKYLYALNHLYTL